ncbi:DJ-1/PfpI family protein [Actinocorallia sp. A-T 12471]|uniref:DJ-1/PfpI family protein n=1 Tax=Actinocorallia sp. A-T 12471 TaxID=3089813 RepID=UPI0029D0BB06|nr:DJ-1/PfpI family protein [Actinocorallia sp. A-T 12471]MDX6740731.1 DJ-1/PfpI family protein [Actinocorallia sp. A-T 12471]
MQTAILLYDNFTALDAVGPYEVLSRIPGSEIVFVATNPGPIRTDMTSLALTADASLTDITSPDILLVPGGPGCAELLNDEPVLDWIRQADTTTTWTTSVCSGSLLLAAAGLLTGKRATSHWICMELLEAFGAIPTSERVVLDGKHATAAGVSAGIDLALHLTGLLTSDRIAQSIQLVLEYDPQPPYNTGSITKAPPPLVTALRKTNLTITA